MKKLRGALAVGLAVACALSAACRGESEHLARARKLIDAEQWANARTALGQVLKEDPRSREARALLLYSLDREEGVEALTEHSLRILFCFTTARADPSVTNAPKEVRKHVEEQLVAARRALFDRGLDTKDNEDLAAVMVGAARHAYAHDAEEQRKDEAAAILARHGDREAIAHLIQKLKGQAPGIPALYLRDAGLQVVAPLQRALAEPGFTGAAPAKRVLAMLLAGQRARALLQERPALSSVELAPAPKLEENLLEVSDLDFRSGLDLWRVHGLVALMEQDDDARGADALVLLQSWDDSAGLVTFEVHALAEGALRRLNLIDQDGKPVAPTAAVFHRFAAARGGAELIRRRAQAYQVEVDAGRVTRPVAGLRVRLQGYSSRGALVREDGGLWIVKLDAPSQGMTELPVALGSLVEQRQEARTELRDEVMQARLEDGALRVTSVEQRPIAAAGAR